VAGPAQKRGVSVTMAPDDLTVDPGSTVTTTVTIRNLGTRVEEFELITQGPGADFASITPDTLSIYPDLEQRAVVRFAPVRGPQSVAGVTTFEIVARSVVHSDVSDVARGRLTVTPFQSLSAALTPDVSRGRKPARHLVSVTNGGNTPVETQLAFKDQDSTLTFEPQEGAASLQPGDKVELPVLVNGPRRWFGRTERLPFSALVTPTSPHPPITLNGTRQQTPVFPWWVPTAAIAAIVLAMGLYALLPASKVPVITSEFDKATAEQVLKEAKYQPSVQTQPDENVPPGHAIGTDPKGGAVLDHGQPVKLLISQGKCPGCPVLVEVPNVVGKPVDDAKTLLEGMKFTVRTDKQASDERDVDQVIASNPAATTQRPVGSDVTLTVSTGPKEKEEKEENKPSAPIAPVVPLPPAQAQGGQQSQPPQNQPGDKKDQPPGDKKDQPPNQPKPIKVPNLKGGSVAAAAALEKLGLTAKTMKEHSNAVSDGNVLSTKPDPDTEVKPGSEVTLAVAQNTVPVNLIATAAKATWESEKGPFDFPGKDGDVAPFALVRNTVLKDGTPVKVLETHLRDKSFITGVYKLTDPVVPGDHVRARVDLLNGTTGKVTFIVKANDMIIKKVTLEKTAGSPDYQRDNFDADLSSAKGADSIEITTVLADASSTGTNSAGGNPTNADATKDGGVWQHLRLEPQVGVR
jgi:beta-lactam-binding protein with PASTA domain